MLSNQVQYCLAHRGPEDDLLPYAADRDRLVIAYSPLAQGLLSGRYSAANPPAGDVRAHQPAVPAENLERAERAAATLREVADAHEVTMPQAALRLPRAPPEGGGDPRGLELEQVESNAVAGEIELADDEVAALAAAARAFRPVTGRRAVGPAACRSRTALTPVGRQARRCGGAPGWREGDPSARGGRPGAGSGRSR